MTNISLKNNPITRQSDHVSINIKCLIIYDIIQSTNDNKKMGAELVLLGEICIHETQNSCRSVL